MSCKPRTLNKFVSFFGVALGGAASFSAICIHRGDESFYSTFLMPIVSKFVDPELAHEACIFLTKHKLIRCRDTLSSEQAQKLKINVFNMAFTNPVGLAAGFDKNSQAIAGLRYYGFGFAEVGTVTPRAQDGNPKKRIFRIPEDGALVNRCGFNNKGLDYVVDTLSRYDTFEPMFVGLNLGKNKDTTNTSKDYLTGLEKAKDLSSIDYLVINVSSPNTPGLRDLQHKHHFDSLLDDVLTKMDELHIKKPLLIKVAPDLSTGQIEDIANIIMKKQRGEARVSGIILTNTTTTRPIKKPSDSNQYYNETGGLSGTPLRDMSTKVISEFYHHTGGKIPIVGVGGIASGQDAYDKIRAGASLVQLYTSIAYGGPPVVNKIKRELVRLLEADNLTSVADAVGLNHKKR